MLLLEAGGFTFPAAATPDIYFCSIGENALKVALTLADELTAVGFHAEIDILGRSLKAQMKYANKIGAKYTAVIGDDDIENGVLNIKNMETGETLQSDFLSFADTFENEYLAYIEKKEFANYTDFGVEEDG